MKKALLFVVSIFMVGLLMSCVDFEIDAIGRIELQGVDFPDTFVVGDDPVELDLSDGSIKVYDRSTPENLIETIPLNDEAVFWSGTGFVSFVDYVLTLKTETAQSYFVRVSYGGVSIRLNYTVTGDSGPSEWDGSYPDEEPDSFVEGTVEGTNTITLGDAAAFAWFAETLNNDDHLTTTDGYEGYTVTLGVDIDLEGHVWTPIGTEVPFKGSFDGGGNTISGLKYSVDEVEVTKPDPLFPSFTATYNITKSGLFFTLGETETDQVVKNLTIVLSDNHDLDFREGIPYTYGVSIGALAQEAGNVNIEGVHVTGSETITLDLLHLEDYFVFGGIVGQKTNIWPTIDIDIHESEVENIQLEFTTKPNRTGSADQKSNNVGGIIGIAPTRIDYSTEPEITVVLSTLSDNDVKNVSVKYQHDYTLTFGSISSNDEFITVDGSPNKASDITFSITNGDTTYANIALEESSRLLAAYRLMVTYNEISDINFDAITSPYTLTCELHGDGYIIVIEEGGAGLTEDDLGTLTGVASHVDWVFIIDSDRITLSTNSTDVYKYQIEFSTLGDETTFTYSRLLKS
jgi:hypothetical protein